MKGRKNLLTEKNKYDRPTKGSHMGKRKRRKEREGKGREEKRRERKKKERKEGKERKGKERKEKKESFATCAQSRGMLQSPKA